MTGLEDLEEAGSVPVTVGEFEKMVADDKLKWIDAIKDELEPFTSMGVITKMSVEEAGRHVMNSGQRMKQLPGRLVLCKSRLWTSSLLLLDADRPGPKRTNINTN